MKSLVPLARMRLLEVLVRSLAEGPAPVPALGSQADPWGLRAKPAPVRSALPTGTPQRLARPETHQEAPAVGAWGKHPDRRRRAGLSACCLAARPAAQPRPLGWTGLQHQHRLAGPAQPRAPASGCRPARGAHCALWTGPASPRFSLSLSCRYS